jgi:NADP-dependent 3-hydroxy acid dehydrogenase YdfG
MDLRIRMKLALATGPAAGMGDAIARGLAESTRDTVVASGGRA